MKKITEVAPATKVASTTWKKVLVISLFGFSAGICTSPLISAAEASATPKAVDMAAATTNARRDPLLAIDMNRANIVSGLVTRWQGDVAIGKRANFKAELAGLRADQLLAVSEMDNPLDVSDLLDAHATATPTRGALSTLGVSKTGGKTPGEASTGLAVGDASTDLAYTPLTPCRLFDTRTGQTSALGTLGGTFLPNTVRSIVPAGTCAIPATGVKNLFVGFTTVNNTPSSGGFLSLLAPAAPLTTSVDIFNIGSILSAGNATVPTGAAGQFDVFVATANAHVVVDVLGYFSAPTSGNITNSIAGGNVFTVTNTNTAGGSTALRGISTSTGSGGIGVSGSHAGGGYGVLGTAGASGYGLIGTAGASGYGVYGSAPATGYGVFSEGRLGVGIGSVLDFGSQTRQMIQLWGGPNAYGIGVQGGTQYYRLDPGAGNAAGFAWFRGGVHSDVAFDPGLAGLRVMSLSRDGQLVLPQAAQQQIRIGDTAFGGGAGMGMGAQNFATYVRVPDTGSFGIYKNGVHSITEADPGTGGVILAGVYQAANFSAMEGKTMVGTVRAAAFAVASDSALKTAFAAVDAKSILAKVAAMPITSWVYKHDGAMAARHIGPMAQDFSKAFNVGYDDKTITTVDADGVAFAAIKGLNELLKEKDAQILKLQRDMNAIKKRLGL